MTAPMATTTARVQGTARPGLLTQPPHLKKAQALNLTNLLRAIQPAASAVPCQSLDNGGWWISDDPTEARTTAAKCRACPVLEQCARYATTRRETAGVWGGKTLEQRQRTPRAGASRTAHPKTRQDTR